MGVLPPSAKNRLLDLVAQFRKGGICSPTEEQIATAEKAVLQNDPSRYSIIQLYSIVQLNQVIKV